MQSTAFIRAYQQVDAADMVLETDRIEAALVDNEWWDAAPNADQVFLYRLVAIGLCRRLRWRLVELGEDPVQVALELRELNQMLERLMEIAGL